jgi:hypothetical protein
MAAYQNVVGQAQNVAATPYHAYTGELVSPVNGQQQTAISNINGLAGAANPFISSASNLANASTAAVNPTQFSGDQIHQFESPYQQDVIKATLAQINNQNAQQQQQATSNAIQSGAWGGDRAGIAKAALAGQQAIATNSTLANLNNQNYTQALGEFNNQQAMGLGAAQANRAQLLPAAELQASLGNEAVSTGLAGAKAQLGAGTLQQQTGQAQDTAAYQQFQNQNAYPFQTTQWLANIAEGIGSNMGSTSTQTQSAPSSANSIFGGLLGLGSLFLAHGGAADPGLGGSTPHYDSGGVVMPYQVSGAAGYVPQVGVLPVGHTTAPNMSSGNNQQGQNQGLQNLMTGAKDFSRAFKNSSLGDSVQDAIQDLGDAFAKGGNVVSLADIRHVARRHYDGGGVVPDANAVLFDPAALATGTDGLGSAFVPRETGAGSGGLPPAAGLKAAAQPGANDNAPVAVPAQAPSSIPLVGTGYRSLGDAPAVAAIDRAAPRSVRNNNPGNIEDGTFARSMPGYAGSDGRFAIFETPGHGAGAMDNLLTKYGRSGLNTPLAIVSKWAPAGDGGNDPKAYASTVAGKLGIGINDPIDMNDPGQRSALAKAMADVEGGTGSARQPMASRALAYDAPTAASPPQTASAAPSSDQGNTGLLSGLLDQAGIHLPHVSDETRVALLSMGLGMMASPSRNFGMAVGQGGLEGLKTYQAMLQNKRQNALANAQVQNIGSEIQNRGAMQGQGQQRIDLEAKNLTRQAELTAAQIKNQTQQVAQQGENIKSEVGMRAAETASKLQTATPAGMLVRDPANPTAPPKLIPWSAMTGAGNSNSAAVPPAPGSPTAPTSPEAAKSTAVSDPPLDPRLFSAAGQKIAGEETTKTLDTARTASEAAQNTKYQVAQMRHALEQLPANGFLAEGPGFQARKDLANKVNQVLRGLGVGESNLIFDPNQVASGEELQKLTNRMGFDLARTLGGREPGFIVQQAVGSVPGGDNSPLGAKRLLAGIAAMAQRQEDWYNFVQDYSAKTGGSVLDAQRRFNAASPPEKYAAQAVLSTVPAGAADALRQKPELAAQFDQKYGSGVSRFVLGQ